MRLREMRASGRAGGLLAALSGVVLLAAGVPASAATSSDWTAYLNGPMHSSYSATQTAITSADAGALIQKWHFADPKPTMPGQPGPGFLASPTVADGAVFIGSSTGWFYKLSEATGAILDKVFVGYQGRKTCSALGFVDTATVAPGPAGHQDTVYVGGPDGYLYAFSASDLALRWKSVIAIPSARTSNYFEWSSPTVTNGKIYIGVASNCDDPLIRGGVISYDQATGKKLAEFYTVPRGEIGGSVWSSVAVGPGGDVYATTGNGPASAPLLDYSESIIRLSPGLRPLGRFQVPASQVTGDGDFGGSPTIFGRYVGACNKNGVFYVVDISTMALAWEQRIGAPASSSPYAQCDAAAVYNGKDLYIGGSPTTVDGTDYLGSVQERVPGTGALVWATGLPNGVLGSPAMDAGGVVAVGTYGVSSTPNSVFLVNAATGAILRALITGSQDFAQSVFADGLLFTANVSGVYAWGTS